MKKPFFNKKTLQQVASRSSKIEGLSWHRAKRNQWVIKELKRRGRAFSL